jgi:hypothetical protein
MENQGKAMRDIRSDLLERVDRIEGRIKAAHVQCEEKIIQLQAERDAKVADLKSSIALLAKLLEFEQAEMGSAPSGVNAPSPADFLERALIERGPLSKDHLCKLAVKQGYFPDAQSAAQTIDAMLGEIVERKRVCTPPDGNLCFAHAFARSKA